MSWIDNLFPENEKTKVTTVTREESKTKKLSYLDTLRVRQSQADTGTLFGTTQPTQSVNTPEEGNDPGNPLIEIISMGFFGKINEKKVETYDSGWTLADYWMETQWDKMRYAVGIRDLRAFGYEFEAVSEQVSVPFRTPLPIRKVTLLADEVIPGSFNRNRPVQPWILYWLTFDDGENWHPISPMTPNSLNMIDGNTIPAAIEVNSGIPEEERDIYHGYYDGDPVQQVRLKWRLLRPSDNPTLSPVLKSYRLQISLRRT